MKRLTAVFTRGTLVTPDGTKTDYTHDRSLHAVLGQAKELILHVHGHRKSPNAKVTLQAWQSAVPGERPAEVGKVLGSAQPITALRPAAITISGPFMGLVEVVATIEHDTGGGTQEEFDLEVWATLVLD